MNEKGQFKLSQRAKSDLVEIAQHIQIRWGREKRNIYLAKLDEAFHLIALDPTIGTYCHDVVFGFQKYTRENHVIFYQTARSQEVFITRILSRKQDYVLSINAKERQRL